MIESPAEEIARLEQQFFPNITQEVLTETILAYQLLGCWTPETRISRESYERLLDVFMHSGLITQRHPYEACIVEPPS